MWLFIRPVFVLGRGLCVCFNFCIRIRISILDVYDLFLCLLVFRSLTRVGSFALYVLHMCRACLYFGFLGRALLVVVVLLVCVLILHKLTFAHLFCFRPLFYFLYGSIFHHTLQKKQIRKHFTTISKNPLKQATRPNFYTRSSLQCTSYPKSDGGRAISSSLSSSFHVTLFAFGRVDVFATFCFCCRGWCSCRSSQAAFYMAASPPPLLHLPPLLVHVPPFVLPLFPLQLPPFLVQLPPLQLPPFVVQLPPFFLPLSPCFWLWLRPSRHTWPWALTSQLLQLLCLLHRCP